MDAVALVSGLGSLALIFGIAISLVQLRALRTERQEALVIQAYAPFLDTAFTLAYWRIRQWTYRDFDEFALSATLEDWTALDQVATFFEMMGVLYKRGLAKIDLFDDLFAGSLLAAWRLTGPYIRGYRIREGIPDYGQWFEQLAYAMDRRLTELGEPHPPLDEPGRPSASTPATA